METQLVNASDKCNHNVITNYFLHWNEQNISELEKLFHEEVILKDWDGTYSGVQDVLAANKAIFELYPKINISIKHCFQSKDKVAVQLLIKLSDQVTIDVVDIIEIDSGRIVSVTAYKC